MKHILLGLCLLMSTTLHAAAPVTEDSAPKILEQPQLPPVIESGEALAPDITIMRKGKEIITQYRLNGELYMVKIKPDIGPAYYLVDDNGDGNMNVRHNDLDRDIKIPQWVLFSL